MNTTPLQKELKKLEADHLKAEHQHQQRLNDLKSEYSLLETKAPALRELINSLEIEVANVSLVKNNLLEETQKLENIKAELAIEVASKETHIGELQSELTIINSQIAKEQTEINSRLEKYTTNKRLELESTLVEKQNEHAEVELALETAHITVKSLSERANKQNADFEKAKQAHRNILTSLEGDQQDAVDKTVGLQTKIAELELSVKELSYQKATYESNIEKIRLEGKQFADYEVRARRILEVKDSELQEREQNIQIGEQHLQTRRSFLPKL